MNIIPSNEAVNNNFAKFNGGPHLCVDVPNGHFTISARTKEGKQITFAFCPYEDNGPPQCVDIKHHTAAESVLNGTTECQIQRVICHSMGTNAFRSTTTDTNPRHPPAKRQKVNDTHPKTRHPPLFQRFHPLQPSWNLYLGETPKRKVNGTHQIPL